MSKPGCGQGEGMLWLAAIVGFGIGLIVPVLRWLIGK